MEMGCLLSHWALLSACFPSGFMQENMQIKEPNGIVEPNEIPIFVNSLGMLIAVQLPINMASYASECEFALWPGVHVTCYQSLWVVSMVMQAP